MSGELERARKRLDQAKARFQRAQAQERQRERKLDARRKIILGAALLALIKVQPAEKRARLVEALLKRVAAKDLPVVQPVLDEALRSET
ncbi:hypothetical protein [Tranquillimonas alkanivorans]|uniref:Relaxasome subunit MobC n=1 Tax=Tranquillimonas alkanivorans TaxID=441119 RepID=A0A1I5UQ40_9RHOB|nr:hypothetical protein [Tranquillimonas alkanivorans]SFP97342.1 relaxasome subunit MobC [Tranquillimonas alkanivorans]